MNAFKLSVVTFCAVLVWGCVGEFESESESESGPDNVPVVTFSQARTCRVIDAYSVENQASPDEDALRGAMRKAQARAVEKGGDAILIVSTSVAPSRAEGAPSALTLKGQILVCRTDAVGK